MKNLVNKFLIGTLILCFTFYVLRFTAQSAFADGTYGQYGGEAEAGQVMVDKMVRNPLTNEYVDNLGLNDAKFSAEGVVFFKITVQNTGGSTLDEINVTDYLPVYLQYVSGGNYNAMSKDLKRLGFKGRVTAGLPMYAQATGMVNDHVTGCFRHQECRALA